MGGEVFFHVGLAKTATTSIQKYIFPRSSFCYLGKNVSGGGEQELGLGDSWRYIKTIQNHDTTVDSIELREQLEEAGFGAYYRHYQGIIRNNKNILVSDEGFTINPLMHHINALHPFMSERLCVMEGGKRDYFEAGVELAASVWSGSTAAKVKLRNYLLRGSHSCPLPSRIQRFNEIFDISLGRILLVNRDVGSWFVSFFLQVAKTSKSNKVVFGMPLLFLWAGFAAKWDNYLMDSYGFGYLQCKSFFKSLESAFGCGSIDVVDYNENRLIFAENISSILPMYGVDASEALQLVKREGLNVTSRKVKPSAAWAEILASREEFSCDINSFVHDSSMTW